MVTLAHELKDILHAALDATHGVIEIQRQRRNASGRSGGGLNSTLYALNPTILDLYRRKSLSCVC